MAVRSFAAQKAALTRAINACKKAPNDQATYQKLVDECRRARDEWESKDAPYSHGWPDDWARWQRALDDNLPDGRWFGPRLESL